MLRTLSLKNIRGFANAKIGLEPLTVFVGTNGSGKTTILECADAACRSSQARRRFNPQASQKIFTGRLAPTSLITRGSASAEIFAETESARLRLDVEPNQVRRGESEGELPRSMILRLVPEKLAAPSYLTDAEPELAGDGGRLASVLDYLIGLRDGSIEKIEEDLRAIIPQARRLRVLPHVIESETIEDLDDNPAFESLRRVTTKHVGSRYELDFGKMGFIPASDLSEGTLIAIGILTVIHSAASPTLALFDDLDRGLHPTAQTDLIKTLRELVEQRGDLQIMCTTHSSYALDAFSAAEAHVTWMDENGVGYHRRLSEHPEWPRWESVMDAGEFWSTVGERWVGESDPQESA